MEERVLRGGSIVGEPIGGTGAPRRYASGRVCAHEGCGARLSMYNSSSCCALHDLSAMASSPPRGLIRKTRSQPVSGRMARV